MINLGYLDQLGVYPQLVDDKYIVCGVVGLLIIIFSECVRGTDGIWMSGYFFWIYLGGWDLKLRGLGG